MENMNSVAIVGNIVADAKLNKGVLQVSVAVNSTKKDGDKYVDYPNYIDCVMFGKRAEALSKYLVKGAKVAVNGKLHQSRWEADGVKKSKLEIWIDNVELMQQPKKESTSQEDYIPF